MIRRSKPPHAAFAALLASAGAMLIAPPAWRAERLPRLIAAAPHARTGLSWEDGGLWDADPPPDPPRSAVLLVHGLDEPGGIWDALAPAIASTGRRVARFDYPNDQPIADSADLLRGALRDLRELGVERVEVVAHSMGGLVTRDALTRPTGPAPAVPLLITLGTPHAGSAWAAWQPLAEAREQVQRWAESDDRDPARLFAFTHDGVGEAGVDLRPGSRYLTELNARPAPAGTRIVCVVAVAAAVPLDAGIGGLSDAVSRLGDGVVPAASAALPGADEVLLVHANHRSMVRPIELGEWVRRVLIGPQAPPPPEPPALPLVLERLAEPLPARPETLDSQTPP